MFMDIKNSFFRYIICLIYSQNSFIFDCVVVPVCIVYKRSKIENNKKTEKKTATTTKWTSINVAESFVAIRKSAGAHSSESGRFRSVFDVKLMENATTFMRISIVETMEHEHARRVKTIEMPSIRLYVVRWDMASNRAGVITSPHNGH